MKKTIQYLKQQIERCEQFIKLTEEDIEEYKEMLEELEGKVKFEDYKTDENYKKAKEALKRLRMRN